MTHDLYSAYCYTLSVLMACTQAYSYVLSALARIKTYAECNVMTYTEEHTWDIVFTTNTEEHARGIVFMTYMEEYTGGIVFLTTLHDLHL